MSSILNDVKQQLGLATDYTPFDVTLILHINSVLSNLHQLGIGPPEGLEIVDDSEEWVLLIGNNKRLNMVKTYVYLKVRLVWDPPTTAHAIRAVEEEIEQLAWRIKVAKETPADEGMEV